MATVPSRGLLRSCETAYTTPYSSSRSQHKREVYLVQALHQLRHGVRSLNTSFNPYHSVCLVGRSKVIVIKTCRPSATTSHDSAVTRTNSYSKAESSYLHSQAKTVPLDAEPSKEVGSTSSVNWKDAFPDAFTSSHLSSSIPGDTGHFIVWMGIFMSVFFS